MLTAPSAIPIAGPHGEDVDRIRYTRRSRRILYGEHRQDVLDRLEEQLGRTRREAWGVIDLSSNPFKLVWSSLATLYDEAPTVSGDEGLASAVAAAGLWPMMQRTQRDALALREMWMRVDVADLPDGGTELVYEPVYPDLVIAYDSGDRPGVPVDVWFARRRETRAEGRSGPEWLWDHYDLRDPDAPSYTIETTEGAKNGETVDVSASYPDSGAGAGRWPDRWRDGEGRPVLPLVLYHAARTPRVYDPYQTRELVEGTLNVALMRTHIQHVIKQASWAQRYIVDAVVQGLGVDEGRPSIVTDPATVLMLRSVEDGAGGGGKTAQVSQWGAPSDPSKLMELTEAYERKLMAESGVRPDVTRSSGDPRSGYALSVDRESQREAQRRFEPQFRRGDLELLRLSAVLLNRAGAGSYAESGYEITYRGVPQSAQEREAQRRHLLELINAGLVSPVSAYQSMHPGTSDEQALEALVRIEEIRRIISPAEATQAADTPDEPDPQQADTPDPQQPDPAADPAGGLNGAQSQAAVSILQLAGTGELTTGQAEIMLRSIGVPPEDARALIADVGQMQIPEPTAAPAPAAPADTTPGG